MRRFWEQLEGKPLRLLQPRIFLFCCLPLCFDPRFANWRGVVILLSSVTSGFFGFAEFSDSGYCFAQLVPDAVYGVVATRWINVLRSR